jgi:uncharacterized protein (TIGR02722 family)
MKTIVLLLSALIFTSCSSFKAERVNAKTSDEQAMGITDSWVAEDTRQAVEKILAQMKSHRGFKKYMKNFRGEPKVFIAEVQNNTAEAYFPIADMNDEFLNEVSAEGEFILVDAKARNTILKELTYQNDGMVDPSTAKSIGKQLGADLMIFGSVYMKPEKRDGKTLKQYSVNIRLTDIEKGIEVMRTRTRVYKYSNKKSYGW